MALEQDFTGTQRRALAVATVAALAFGAYFLRSYFVLIVVAAVGAYLFTPLFTRLNRRLPTGLSATGTLLAALAIVFIPIGGCLVLEIGRASCRERVAVRVVRV